MRKLLLGLAASSVLVAAGAANASINVSYWINQSGVAQNATIANIQALGAASGSGTVNAINFSTGNSDATSIDSWLGVSTGANGGHAMDNTVFLFTGSAFLHAGVNNLSVAHDDGLQIHFDGIAGFPVNQPGPTAPTTTAFTVTAPSAGTYNFELGYGECCGGPAVLQITLNQQALSGTPEPATWGLMLVGFGGLGAMLRRRRSVALAA